MVRNAFLLFYLLTYLTIFPNNFNLRHNRKLGIDDSTAEITVEFTDAGDYVVNVSFLSKGNRPLAVQVNNDAVKGFMFVSSSQYWCNDKAGGIGRYNSSFAN